MDLSVSVAERLRTLVRQHLVLVWVIAVVAPLTLAAQFTVGHRIDDALTPAYEQTQRLQLTMRFAQSELRLFHDTRRSDLAEDLPRLRTESVDLLGELQAGVGGIGVFDGDITEVSRSMNAWWDKAEAVMREVAAARKSDSTTPIGEFDRFTHSSDHLASRLADRRNTLRTVWLWVFVAGVLLSVAAAIIGATVDRRRARAVTRAITIPLALVDEVVARQRAGELDARADPQLGPSEIRNLALALNDLLDEKRRLVQAQAGLTHAQSIVLRADQLLREAPTLYNAGDLLTETLACELSADLAVLRFQSVTGDAVTRFWADPDGPLAGIDERGVDELVPGHLPELGRSGGEAVCDAISPVDTASPELREHARSSGLRGFVASPITIDRDHLGSLAVVTVGTHEWAPHDGTTVDQVAAIFGRSLFERIAHHTQRRNMAELQEFDRQKDAFISTVSHELRTPLTSITGYTEMLTDGDAGELSPAQRSIVEVISRNSVRLQGLIEDLLILNRIESSNLKVEREEVDLADVARVVAENLAPFATRRRVAVDVDAPVPVRVAGGQGHLERAVSNLVSNAVKFSSEGDRVALAVARSHGAAVISVRDEGIGVPYSEQRKLSERFYRATNAQTASIPGTGLGLSIVRAIAEGHHGRLDFSSEEGVGSTFRITLPMLGGAALPEPDPADTSAQR